MKRYLLFAGYDYSPEGGADDLVGVYEEIEDAYRASNVLRGAGLDWSNIYDLHEDEIIELTANMSAPDREEK